MKTRTFTTAALAVALSTSMAWAQESASPAAAGQMSPAGQTGQSGQASQPGISGSHSGSGTSGATSPQPGMSASQPGMPTGQTGAAGQQAARFTDAKTFVQEELQEQEATKDIYEMAEDKAKNEAVKNVAKTALKDHKQAADKLKEVAKGMNLDTDQAPTAQSPHVQQARSLQQRLQSASPEQFDRAFLTEIINMHQQEIARFQAASTQAQEQAVKQFAQEALPKLQQHLQAAQSAYQQVTGTAWTPSDRSFTPTATYESQPGHSSSHMQNQSGQSSPGMSSSQPDTSSQIPSGTSPQSGTENTGQSQR